MSFSVEIGFDCYDAMCRNNWVDVKIDGDTCSGDDPDVIITVANTPIPLEKVVAISKVPALDSTDFPLVDRCMAIRIVDEYHKLKKVYDVALVMLA